MGLQDYLVNRMTKDGKADQKGDRGKTLLYI